MKKEIELLWRSYLFYLFFFSNRKKSEKGRDSSFQDLSCLILRNDIVSEFLWDSVIIIVAFVAVAAVVVAIAVDVDVNVDVDVDVDVGASCFYVQNRSIIRFFIHEKWKLKMSQ